MTENLKYIIAEDTPTGLKKKSVFDVVMFSISVLKLRMLWGPNWKLWRLRAPL